MHLATCDVEMVALFLYEAHQRIPQTTPGKSGVQSISALIRRPTPVDPIIEDMNSEEKNEE